MIDLFFIVKVVAITQLVMVGLLFFFAYIVKILTYYYETHQTRIQTKIEAVFESSLKQARNDFKPTGLRRYKKNLALLTASIKKLDRAVTMPKWQEIREKTIERIIRPQALKLSTSKNWTTKIIVCQALQLSLKPSDGELVKFYIQDPIPLVSLNAILLAIQSKSQVLVDAVIDYFSEGRRIQQSLFAQVISHADETIIPMIKNRLNQEQNPYSKAFCYRTLADLTYPSELVASAFVDINTSNLDLKLAVMTYLQRKAPESSTHLFLTLLNDKRWEIRARSAMLLGEIGDDQAAIYLEPCLKDTEWWVRINAGEALAKLGNKGMAVLKRQTPAVDKFAYDVASQILAIKAKANFDANRA